LYINPYRRLVWEEKLKLNTWVVEVVPQPPTTMNETLVTTKRTFSTFQQMHSPKFDDSAIWNTLKCIQKKQFKYRNLNWNLMLEPFTLSKSNLVQAYRNGTWTKQQCNRVLSRNVQNTKLKMHWILELSVLDGSRDTLILQFVPHLHSKSTKVRSMNIICTWNKCTKMKMKSSNLPTSKIKIYPIESLCILRS
jgi:hypothetical protein